jgi:hypothetical protein
MPNNLGYDRLFILGYLERQSSNQWDTGRHDTFGVETGGNLASTLDPSSKGTLGNQF